MNNYLKVGFGDANSAIIENQNRKNDYEESMWQNSEIIIIIIRSICMEYPDEKPLSRNVIKSTLIAFRFQ